MGSLANDSSYAMKGHQDGLGNQSLLDKIDKLRALNIGAEIPLPQLVAVGDQSSGKSSVLESLTGFSFPRAAGLCTRYATQITCRRESQQYTDISIIPSPSSSKDQQEKLRAFHRRVPADEPGSLAAIFDEANREMGIRPLDDDDGNSSLSTFSEHILKVEICGPDQVHLTVIDVPGIFRTATPGLTTESDITLVRDLVKRYMKDSRTIILAVIPCNVDIATQEILTLAKEADPKGVRTMGVLTKPDLVIERATQQAVIDLINKGRKDLSLGYYVLKNRNADDQESTTLQRHEQETAFFRQAPWSSMSKTASDRIGVDALKGRLRELLMVITKKEFPNVKAEINNRLKRCKEEITGYGEPRSDSQAQRAYMGRLANEFQKVVNYALEANYVHAEVFEDKPHMRLITRVVELNEKFAHEFWKRGHARKFVTDTGRDDGAERKGKKSRKEGRKESEEDTDRDDIDGSDSSLFDLVDSEEYPELDGIITEPENCEPPSKDSLMDHIQTVYLRSRGAELGTFGSAILATVFKEQAKKWKKLALSHVSRAILLVHDFIVQMLAHTIADEAVRKTLWDDVIFDNLCKAYKKAMNHAEFLLSIELNSRPTTFNDYFSSNLNKFKLRRIENYFQDKCQTFNAYNEVTGAHDQKHAITLAQLRTMTVERSNAQQVQEDIHDLLMSYYKVARKRFVDCVCQQVVDHFLLYGKQGAGPDEKSPLSIFDSDLILSLDESKLEDIAGEDPWTKQQRDMLATEIKNLTEATKVLRG